MTKPRTSQVSLDQTSYYHVVNRCVRRAFLCGVDNVSGHSYEHRREWIERRIMQLSSVFSIDIAAFAIMSNHYHIVTKVNQDQALAFSDDEVLERWTQLFSSTQQVQYYLALKTSHDPIPDYLQEHVSEIAETYRHRLYDLSWFMRVLNESIARMANKEDGVTGRFWEGRFKSQAILDEAALMSVMAYVDLNPVRAQIAEDLPSSDYTSIQARLTGKYNEIQTPEYNAQPQSNSPETELTEQEQAINAFLARLQNLSFNRLLPFHSKDKNALPFEFEHYLEFTDYIGRAIHPNKKGSISEEKPTIMQQLGINSAIIEQFQTNKFLESFGNKIGNTQNLKPTQEEQSQPLQNKQHNAIKVKQRNLKGVSIASMIFENA